MFCCVAAALLAPLGLWAVPTPNGQDCCAVKRRIGQVAGVIALGLLVMGGIMLLQPAPFRHICSLLVRP